MKLKMILGLFIITPLVPVIVLAIVAETRGGVIVKLERVSEGNVIRVYKFRSMVVDAEKRNHEVVQETRDGKIVHKFKNDPRVTRVGRFLRRTSIDELPQLFNVLFGDMSLVGPRPHALGTKAEGKRFDEAVENYMRRYRVKPGLTGWAQVNGWRGETDTNVKLMERVRYDIEYIENWNFWLDLYILAITPVSLVVRSRNAY